MLQRLSYCVSEAIAPVVEESTPELEPVAEEPLVEEVEVAPSQRFSRV